MVTVKKLHCDRIPTIIIYGDNMIAWKRTSNVCSNPKYWSHSFMVRNYRKFRNITIDNGDGEMKPLCLEKKNDDL